MLQGRYLSAGGCNWGRTSGERWEKDKDLALVSGRLAQGTNSPRSHYQSEDNKWD